MRLLALLLSFSLGITAATARAEIQFASGPGRTSLLELYTSEGCSSCPPAEAQLSQLKNKPGLWKTFVPVAFHVDYWDRLGWRDRFSSPQWTARQSRYASLWQSESVYTPAFVLNGRELRGGPGSVSWPNDIAGTLKATSADGKTWSIEFHPSRSDSAQWEAHVALLGAGISSKIGAGENSGRKLEHDFVVLNLQEVPLESGRARLTIAKAPAAVPREAVAIWITRRGELAPVQAAGGWLAAR
jgi:hypothetical protein